MPLFDRNRTRQAIANTLAPHSIRSGGGQVDSLWVGQFGIIGASGSFTSQDVGGFTYVRFTSSGTFAVSGTGTAQVLVVAGGGGGGGNGGGGGGGIRLAAGNTYQNLNFSSGFYSVTVGSGGTGSYSSNGFNTGTIFAASKGGNSSITHDGGTLSATGGGGGEWVKTSLSTGGSGGGTNIAGGGGTGNAGGYSPPEGNNGGVPNGTGEGSTPGGGGGGFSAAASLHNGGAGLTVSSLDANLSTVLSGHSVISSGGGAVADCNFGGTGGAGGTGAGSGGYLNNATSATTYGSGGGGGGGCVNGIYYTGGNGFQGVVVIRFAR